MKKYKHFFSIGVTGHRDISKEMIPVYKEEIKKVLSSIHFGNREPLLYSPLADGADRVFIEAGKELGLRYKVILPMPLELYIKDFDEESLNDFNRLSILADSVETINLVEGNSFDSIKEYGDARDKQYKAVGEKIAEADLMVALWDGIDNGKVGGTSDIVNIRRNVNLPFYHLSVERVGA